MFTPYFAVSIKNLSSSKLFWGPRQVGKTTGVLQLNDLLKDHAIIYENPDSVFSSKTYWLKDRWLEARLKVQDQKKVIFIIDEVQSIPDWSRMKKGLWDQDKRQKNLFHVVLLGSSSLELHQGLYSSQFKFQLGLSRPV